MTCNLINNENELISAFNQVNNSQNGNDWVIFGYDGTSSIIKVETSGNDGLNQLIKSFDNSKIQYGFITIIGNINSLRKVVLIHWQGEGVPPSLLSSKTSHVEEIKRFVRHVNLTIYARNEEDLDKNILQKHFDKLFSSEIKNVSSSSLQQQQLINNNNNNIPFIPPNPKENQYSSILKKEINLNEREKFWDEMKDEEELRRKEELNKKRQIQLKYENEQKEMTEKIHKIHLEKLEEIQKKQQIGKLNSFDSSSINSGKMGKLISGRTQLFEQKVAELAETKPLKKPKNFKWKVNIQNRLNTSSPINLIPIPPPKQYEFVLLKRNEIKSFGECQKEEEQQKPPQEPILNKIPIAPIPPIARIPILNQQNEKNFEENKEIINNEKEEKELNSKNNNNISPPPNEPIIENEKQIVELTIDKQNNNEKIFLNEKQNNNKEIKAKALWDYKAEDNTELTFNPDDIISDIQMVHDGWWYGRSPNGTFGLFPSNYVQLL